MVRSPLPIFGNAFSPASASRRSRRSRYHWQWQAGAVELGKGTSDNHRYRVTLNGEPVPTAIAADVDEGTVTLYVDPPRDRTRFQPDGPPLNLRVLRGDVRIVEGDRA